MITRRDVEAPLAPAHAARQRRAIPDIARHALEIYARQPAHIRTRTQQRPHAMPARDEFVIGGEDFGGNFLRGLETERRILDHALNVADHLVDEFVERRSAHRLHTWNRTERCGQCGERRSSDTGLLEPVRRDLDSGRRDQDATRCRVFDAVEQFAQHPKRRWQHTARPAARPTPRTAHAFTVADRR